MRNVKLTVLLDFSLQNEALGRMGGQRVRDVSVKRKGGCDGRKKSQETLMFLVP